MRLSRAVLLGLGALLTMAPLTPGVGQSTGSSSNCIDNAYWNCVPRSGGVEDLREVQLGTGDRELRYWEVSGMFMPDRLLRIRAFGDSVTGEVLLFWGGLSLADTFAVSRCARRWIAADSIVCVGRTAGTSDWRALLSRLDALGLAKLPGNPVPERRCNETPRASPTRPGVQVITGCFRDDGFDHVLEVRSGNLYWRYTFADRPDHKAPAFKRDSILHHALACGMWLAADGECR